MNSTVYFVREKRWTEAEEDGRTLSSAFKKPLLDKAGLPTITDQPHTLQHCITLFQKKKKKKGEIWSLSPTYFPDQTVLLIFVHTCVAKEGISIHFCVQGSSKHTCCPRNTVGRSGAACTGIFTGTTGDFSKMKVKGQTWHTKPPLAVTKHATFHILSQFDDGRVKIITMRKSKLIHL